MAQLRTVFPVLVALGMAAAGCLSVRADAPEVRLTRTDLQMPAAGLALGGRPVSVTVRFDSPYEPVELPSGVDSELRPDSLTLTSTSGIADLSVIDSFQVRIGATDPTAPPPALLFDRQSPFDSLSGTQLVATTELHPNVLDYWTKEGAWYELTVTGALPDHVWIADLEVTFSGTASYTP